MVIFHSYVSLPEGKFGFLNPQCGNGSKSGSPHPQRWDGRASQLATCSERASGSPGDHAATVSSMPWESKPNGYMCVCIYIYMVFSSSANEGAQHDQREEKHWDVMISLYLLNKPGG